MLGHGHAIMGAAGFVAVAGPLHLVDTTMVGVPAVVTVGAGALVAAGAALLPDLDHRGATVSRALPPITTVLSMLIGAVSGGHRKGTHSLLAVAVVGVLAWAASLAAVTVDGEVFHPGIAVVSAVIASLGLKALRVGFTPVVSWGLAVGVGVLVWVSLSAGQVGWFPVAVMVGYAIHLVGDFLTTSGVPAFLPVTGRKVVFPILGNTGSFREHLLTLVCAVMLVFMLVTVH